MFAITVCSLLRRLIGWTEQSGRRINDGMGKFLAEQTIKEMIAAGSYIKGARVNVLGLTFTQQSGIKTTKNALTPKAPKGDATL